MYNLESLKSQLNQNASTSVQLIDSSLQKLEENKDLNAFISVLSDEAKAQALESDNRRQKAALHSEIDGIPIAIKDNLCLQCSKTTAASKMLENFVSPYTATAVQKLKDAGAIIIGKTNMDEFAMGVSSGSSYFGPVKNPLDTSKDPGGSSGGSAVAVAAKIVPLALGSDTCGSVRQPAAQTGIVGFKPSYGRVSRYGLIALASSLDQIGFFTHTVRDAATALSIVAGLDPKDNTTIDAKSDFSEKLGQSLEGKKIGVPKEYFGKELDPQFKTQIEATIDLLQKNGATIQEVSLPHFSYAMPCYQVISTAEASSNLSRYDGVRYTYRSSEAKNLNDLYSKTRGEAFGEGVKHRILLGSYVLGADAFENYFIQAQKMRTLISEDFDKAFETCDVLLNATTPKAPLAIGESSSFTESDIYTVSASLAGLPAISIPCAKVGNSPVGLHLTGNYLQEAELLSIASACESIIQYQA